MRGILSIVIVVAIVFGGYVLILKRIQPADTGSTSAEAVSLVGVQNDLLAIAQAERAYFALNGSYASLEELTKSGTLAMPRLGRDGYPYALEITERGFNVTARFTGQLGKPSGPAHPTVIVDQALQVRQSD